MAEWKSSSHCSRWIFTQKYLNERRMANIERAAKSLKERGSTKSELEENPSLVPKSRFSDQGVFSVAERDGQAPLPEMLTVGEEAILRKFYESKIQEVCSAFGFPLKIQATATHYFKRFFLEWSISEHHPKSIMLTCIYLACKVDEAYVSAEAFGRGIQQDPKLVLDHELTLLHGLNFDLICYGPFRAIEGFLHDIKMFTSPNEPSQETVQALRQGCSAAVAAIFLTDAPLLFAPGQLALAALRLANNSVKAVPSFKEYVRTLVERHGGEHTEEELMKKLQDIEEMVKAGGQVPAEKVTRRIDRKLRLCQEPQLWAEELEKKKGKKEKGRGKRVAAQDGSMTAPPPNGQIVASPSDNDVHEAKRRKSADEALLPQLKG